MLSVVLGADGSVWDRVGYGTFNSGCWRNSPTQVLSTATHRIASLLTHGHGDGLGHGAVRNFAHDLEIVARHGTYAPQRLQMEIERRRKRLVEGSIWLRPQVNLYPHTTTTTASLFWQVANIRFNVANELQSVSPHCGVSSYQSQVLPVLTVLMDDDDRDVRFFAEKAVSALEEAFADSRSDNS